MKKTAIILLFLACLSVNALAQTAKTESNGKAELRAVLDAFMESVKTKNVEKFYSLFHEEPIVWVGVYKDKTQQSRILKDSTVKNQNFKSDGYKTFIQNIANSKSEVEEKFYNIAIEEDGYAASITFDYSFWANGTKRNWGKESWGLIKANNQWKITSVIYSIEFEGIEKEPQR